MVQRITSLYSLVTLMQTVKTVGAIPSKQYPNFGLTYEAHKLVRSGVKQNQKKKGYRQVCVFRTYCTHF